MKLIKKVFLFILMISVFTACKKYLNVNSDPTSPQTPDLASLMTPSTSIMGKMQTIDVITVGQLIQNFSISSAASENYDVHGGNAGGSGANALWRSFYAQQGENLNLVMAKARQEERWDYLGAAIALRAWGLQMTTNYFGEMPYYQAWDPNRFTFAYETQPTIYRVIDSLCLNAIDYLSRKDGAVNQASMARGDNIYGGNTDKWIKFVYGVRARHWQHLTNKSTYNPDSVIYFVDHSFFNAADNFMVPYNGTRNDDSNPWGPARNNLDNRRQSRFIVQLLDGTSFFGNTSPASRDPRIRGLLSVSSDTTTVAANYTSLNGGYRFIPVPSGDANQISGTGTSPNNSAITGLPTNAAYRQRVSTLYGDSIIVNTLGGSFSFSSGKFLFRNPSSLPIMAYHELQFIKAEAAFRKGKPDVAYPSYLNGISTHFDFVENLNRSSNPTISGIASQYIAYKNSGAVKPNSGLLTLTDIMLQKYIGDFGWNLVECWSDIRRYHYFDLDPITGLQVYRNFNISTYSTSNQGPHPEYRYRPTNFSEFDWNYEELRKLGAVNIDYHTYEMWFSQP
ncbi:MAG: SusD/RagB family nutrient-binding outer membrane lipoprotein [Bacteroidota bacterium]|nr:SusD/RagB family nutrient-binding outer membrane lipoprotein [Bacteroidota bacterium]